MASDDRDKTFEKALARQLRSSVSSSPEAKAVTGAPAAPLAGLCPDPETLAAYHDGSLSLEERNFWKQHVVSCDSCQLVLAHLATPLDIPAGQVAKENVMVAQQRAASARATSAASVARPSPLHSLRWLWLVPAGAIAAALIAWVSLQTPKPLPVATSSPVEVAENRQPAVAAPSPKPALPASTERKRKDQAAAPSAGVAAEGDSTDRGPALKESQNQLQQNQRALSQNAPAAHGPYLNQQKQEQQINRIAAGKAGAADQKKLDAPSIPKATGQATGALAARALTAPAPLPPPPSPEPAFVADGAVPPPPAAKVAPPQPAPAAPSKSSAPDTSSTTADTITSSGAITALEVSGAPESLGKTRAMMRAAALQNPHVFGAPGGKHFWRIGPAGSLEHSKDKGLNWIPQISGVHTDLLAGSAPSAKVCWIVGTSGTILRTTDGGTHWTKLDSPVTNDLTGIRAEDAMQAWIWFVPDQQTGLIKTYQTSDGGRTWSSAPSDN